MFLRTLAHFDPKIGISFDQCVTRFNVNVDYSGLHLRDILDSREKDLIYGALNSARCS